MAGEHAQARLLILERLVLRTALLVPVIGGGLSVDESHGALLDWLDGNAAPDNQPKHFREAVEELKGLVDQVAIEVKTILDHDQTDRRSDGPSPRSS